MDGFYLYVWVNAGGAQLQAIHLIADNNYYLKGSVGNIHTGTVSEF